MFNRKSIKNSRSTLSPYEIDSKIMNPYLILSVLLITSSLLTACGGSSKPGEPQSSVAPSITSSASLTAQEGITYVYDVNATDANSTDVLAYSLVSSPSGMTINASNGIIKWTPGNSQVGSHNISIQVSDNGSPALSVNQTFSISVTPADTPVSKSAIIRVNAGGNDYVDSSGTFWSGDFGYNIGGTFTRTNAISGTVDDTLYQSEHWHSDWKNPASDELEYQFNVPSGDYAVILHFAEVTESTYRIFDVEIEGQLEIDDLIIENEAGRYNVLTRNIATTVSDGVLNIRFPRNTQSPKVSAIEVLPITSWTSTETTDISPVSVSIPGSSQISGTFTIISQPSNGTASVEGSNITYSPNTGFGGEDTVVYMLVEDDGSVTISTITVAVDAVSTTVGSGTDISANPDSSSTTSDTAVNIPVLANDSGVSSNAVLSIEGKPSNGAATVLANNTITYTPGTSFSGSDSFSYKVIENNVMSVATVTIDVKCTQCNADKLITLNWNPSVAGSDTGYLIYYGEDSKNLDKLALDLSSSNGLNQQSPSAQFMAKKDLNLNIGDKVCFRIKAYNSTETSKRSTPVCGTL